MESNNNKSSSLSSSSSSFSSSKTDQKMAENSGRREMKDLCSSLYSLLPHQTSMEVEARSLPDQIEEATNYIKKLKKKVEKLQEKKERMNKNPNGEECSGIKVKVEKATDSTVKVIIVTSSCDYHLVFRESICLLQEEGANFLTATHSTIEDHVFITILAKVAGEEKESRDNDITARISERLKNAFGNMKMA